MLSQLRVSNSHSTTPPQLLSLAPRRRRVKKWKCNVPETFIGDYLIVPLISEKMLKFEDYLMNNCSREYAFQCGALQYCLFSIRSRSGERLATLGLSYEEDYWRFDQCFGPSNTEVLEETCGYIDDDGVLQTELIATELYYVAHEVARLMNSSVGSH